MRNGFGAGAHSRQLLLAIALVLLPAVNALGAEEGGGGWRPMYDNIMLFVNFGILVFLFFKFLKKPLVDFLKLRGEALARDIKKLEEEKQRAEEKSRETLALLKQGEAHIEKIKTKIIEQGEAAKEEIINAAKEQSRYMLENSKQRLGSRILYAKQAFRAELVESAITLAMEKLPKELTEEDNRIFVNDFLAGLK